MWTVTVYAQATATEIDQKTFYHDFELLDWLGKSHFDKYGNYLTKIMKVEKCQAQIRLFDSGVLDCDIINDNRHKRHHTRTKNGLHDVWWSVNV